MSAEARMLGLIEDAVRRETEPLREAVDALSARLAAVEGSDGAPDAETAKRPTRGRTAKAKAQPAEATATAGEAKAGTAGDSPKAAPAQRADEAAK